PSARRRRVPRTPGSPEGIALSVTHGRDGTDRQGLAGRGLLAALPRASARRLLVLVLPRRQSPRRGGPHRADLPAGLPPLRARPARVGGPAAAAVAHPDRPQPGGELLPRPLAPSPDADRRRRPALRAAHDRGAGGG